MTQTETLQPDQLLALLSDVVVSSESDTSRIQAAKLLLDRIVPKEDDEAKRNEVAERDAALATARGLLAEFAVIKLENHRLQSELDKASQAETANASG